MSERVSDEDVDDIISLGQEPMAYLTKMTTWELASDLRDARAEIARLRGIVDRLRKTEDGVPMVPGGHYWSWCRDRWAEDEDPCILLELVWWAGGGDDCFNPEYTMANETHSITLQWEFFNVGKVYSNREAAEAAKEKR